MKQLQADQAPAGISIGMRDVRGDDDADDDADGRRRVGAAAPKGIILLARPLAVSSSSARGARPSLARRSSISGTQAIRVWGLF